MEKKICFSSLSHWNAREDKHTNKPEKREREKLGIKLSFLLYFTGTHTHMNRHTPLDMYMRLSVIFSLSEYVTFAYLSIVVKLSEYHSSAFLTQSLSKEVFLALLHSPCVHNPGNSNLVIGLCL